MTYFDTPDDMLKEAETLIRENAAESQDQATLAGFYNGRPLESEDAGNSGTVKNHLMGYDTMSDASLQIERIYTNQKLPWKIALPNSPIDKRSRWEMAIQDAFNLIVRESKRFKPQWKGLSGAVTLMGRGCLVHLDRYDWCPEAMEPLVPRRTGILACDVPYAIIPGQMTIKELKDKLASARSNPDTRWRVENLQAAVGALTNNIGSEMSTNSVGQSETVTQAERAEANLDGPAASLRTTILVFHIYENCMEESGAKYVKHTVMARHEGDLISSYQRRTGKNLKATLFEDENFADRPEEWLHPYFIDCQIGRATTWHRTMGLGRLNYDSDVEVEAFFNEAMDGSMENLRRLYTVSENGDRESLEQWVSSNRGSNIIPEGLQAAEVGKNPNFQYAFQVIDMLKRGSANHAKSSVPNSQEGTSKELEVQAIERQGRAAITLATRMEDIYDNTDALGSEMLRRFITIDPLPQDRAYHEITRFQDALKKAGIPLARLREKGKDGRLKNVTVATNRSMGQGDRVAEVMVNRMLMSRLYQFSPQAQEIIKRRVVATETGDYDLAQELVPDRPSIDPRQIERANGENQACLMRGITGYVPQINDDDMTMYHIPEHMGGLEAMLAKGQAQGWEPMDVGGFKALGAHTALHIQQLEADPEQKNTARQLLGRLQQLGNAGSAIAKQMEAKQAEDEISAAERIRLQQKDRQLAQADRKQDDTVRDRIEKNTLAAAELASKDVAVGTKMDIERQKVNNDIFKTDSDNALKLNEFANDSQQPA